MFRRIVFVLALSTMAVSAIDACPFCPSAEQTLLNETKQALFVVFGTLDNAVRDPEEFGRGTTDFTVDTIIKDHDFLKGKKKFSIPKYVPPNPKVKQKHLIFFELYKDQVDPYRGIEVTADSKLGEYLKSAWSLRDKPIAERLGFYFKHFESNDFAISADAFQEFSNADYKDVAASAKTMDPDALIKMLQNPDTSKVRYGLIGLLIGHCGKESHAAELRRFINTPEVRSTNGLDGLLAGLVLLDSKAGLAFIDKLTADPKEDFFVRYAALRSLRFFWEYRPDLIKKDQVVKSILPLVDQPDICDLVIDDLRKWHRWEVTDKLIALFDHPTHEINIVQRSIIKFSLCVPPENASAAKFLKRLKADPKHAERVNDLVELLEFEKPRPVVAPKSTAKSPR